ncbi:MULTISPECIES: hypothetical protein [unclassified Variovorax]|uniref:hypothetical protein n=1 Tax=unclassified Variovorax TaxID=663243 RepID=UPI002577C398|nr:MULTISPECIES: hypothetical protein [unclassified Variovorax]MDM0089280.1 hypothetical protein [Variovorax sp. J22G40]MDM0147353.1 hypothetical protein [Variovorax sp. J2P1-31]
MLFLLCALFVPDSMQDCARYERCFHARRAWFFGLLDVVDTLIKGDAHFARFNTLD